MARTKSRSPGLDELIRRIDRAVSHDDTDALCLEIKAALTEIVSGGSDLCDASFLQPSPEKYARRLLHRDPEDRYTIVVMVWDRGQATPLHDHSGKWCVECVYRGRIDVTSFNLVPSDTPARFSFHKETVVKAGVGEAGALIPPFEYHRLENAGGTPAVTIHVYSGEMTWYNAFLPAENGEYRRERRELSYTV